MAKKFTVLLEVQLKKGVQFNKSAMSYYVDTAVRNWSGGFAPEDPLFAGIKNVDVKYVGVEDVAVDG